jgi:hypothetical protein
MAGGGRDYKPLRIISCLAIGTVACLISPISLVFVGTKYKSAYIYDKKLNLCELCLRDLNNR